MERGAQRHAEASLIRHLVRRHAIKRKLHLHVEHSNPDAENTMPCLHCATLMARVAAARGVNVVVTFKQHGQLVTRNLPSILAESPRPSSAGRRKGRR